MQTVLGTTSYIYPVEENNFLYNVENLSQEFSCIQLLCFGKDYIDDIIGEDNLINLKEISKKTDVKYVLHLPLDLNLLDASITQRKASLKLVQDIIERTEKYIYVDYYIIHMDRCIDFKYPKINLNEKTKAIFSENLSIMQELIPEHMSRICIENTSYDLTFFAEDIHKTKLKTCLDIGHIYLCDDTIANFTSAFKERTKVIHLHGVSDKKDHLCLSKMSAPRLKETFDYLKELEKDQITIIEVFNRNNLDGCLDVINNYS